MQKQVAIKYFRDYSADYTNAYAALNKNSVRGFLLNERKGIVLGLAKGVQGRVLDIGCGPGVMVNELDAQGLEVWGIDPSLEMIKAGIQEVKERSELDKIKFLVGDAENLSFAGSSFDAVLCIGVLEYLEDDRKALDEILRVSKNKSSLILTFPNALSPFNIIDSLLACIYHFSLRVCYKILNLLGKNINFDNKRMLLSRSVVSRKYYCRRVKRILRMLGYTEFMVRYHGYRFAFLKSLFEEQVIMLNRKLSLSKSFLSWMGIDCVVMAKRR